MDSVAAWLKELEDEMNREFASMILQKLRKYGYRSIRDAKQTDRTLVKAVFLHCLQSAPPDVRQYVLHRVRVIHRGGRRGFTPCK